MAPSETQLPSALRTLSAPNPTRLEAADPTTPLTPDATWQAGPSPGGAEGQGGGRAERPGMTGRPPTATTSVHALSGVEEEVDDPRAGADQQRGQSRR